MLKFRSLKGKTLNWAYNKNDFSSFTEAVWPHVSKAPGFLSELEAFFLYSTARQLGGKSRGIDVPEATHIVEIGSYKGRSSIAIAMGLKDNPNYHLRLTCVDPFFDDKIQPGLKNEFLKNIRDAQVDDRIDAVSKYSHEAIDNWEPHHGIALLWIDGNHEYEFVKDDIQKWGRYLLPGGVIACHDWYLLGVRQAVEELIVRESRFQDLGFIDGNLVTATKVDAPPSGRDRAMKLRTYWAARSGRNSLSFALAMMVHDRINSVFGSLRSFFSIRPPIQ